MEKGIGRFLLVAVLLAAGVPGTGSSTPASPSGFDKGMRFATSREGLDQGFSGAFDFAHLRDLWIRVQVAKLPRTAALHVALLTPEGRAFYETSRNFSRLPEVTLAKPPNADHEVTVFPAKRIQGGFALDLSVPVAGSIFVRYPSPGVWTVQARLVETGESLSEKLEVRFTP